MAVLKEMVSGSMPGAPRRRRWRESTAKLRHCWGGGGVMGGEPVSFDITGKNSGNIEESVSICCSPLEKTIFPVVIDSI